MTDAHLRAAVQEIYERLGGVGDCGPYTLRERKMRRATKYLKKDANHAAVVDELRRQGMEVVELFDPVDLLVLTRAGYLALVEVKMPGRSTWTRKQMEYISRSGMPIIVAKGPQDAVERLRARTCLDQRQKDALAGFLLRESGEKFNSERIDRVLGI